MKRLMLLAIVAFATVTAPGCGCNRLLHRGPQCDTCPSASPYAPGPAMSAAPGGETYLPAPG
ncbi:MAG: hypothetical protein K8U03_27100 [Planctomycetia bacterium]|nr:hypothetical protein [Planctomycetia bacterium]